MQTVSRFLPGLKLKDSVAQFDADLGDLPVRYQMVANEPGRPESGNRLLKDGFSAAVIR